ncbi:MAG: hypothetical protein IJ106_12160 [Parasporobacterium sp.]|nr:hypothetical protein [Parasporobacterium sp.]
MIPHDIFISEAGRNKKLASGFTAMLHFFVSRRQKTHAMLQFFVNEAFEGFISAEKHTQCCIFSAKSGSRRTVCRKSHAMLHFFGSLCQKHRALRFMFF